LTVSIIEKTSHTALLSFCMMGWAIFKKLLLTTNSKWGQQGGMGKYLLMTSASFFKMVYSILSGKRRGR